MLGVAISSRADHAAIRRFISSFPLLDCLVYLSCDLQIQALVVILTNKFGGAVGAGGGFQGPMKTQKAVNKRANILQAAAKVLAEKGYSLTTLADIGAAAGTFAGSLYYYFPSKEKIVEEVLNIGTTSVSALVMDKVKSLPKGISAYEKITIALEEHLQQMLKKDDFVVAYWKIIDQVPEDIRQMHLSLPREYGQFWQKMLHDAQLAGEIREDVDTRLLRLSLIGSMIYALQWFKPDGRYTPKEIADTLAEMFFRGVMRGDNDKVPAVRAQSATPVRKATPKADKNVVVTAGKAAKASHAFAGGGRKKSAVNQAGTEAVRRVARRATPKP